MLRVALPDGEEYLLSDLCLDLNGTLAVDGQPLPGVAELLQELAGQLALHLLTAGTHGGVAAAAARLGLAAVPIGRGEEKANYVRRLGADGVVAVGNGRNDAAMLRAARLGIAVIGAEGAAVQAVMAADIVVADPIAALLLLSRPQRLVATLRS